MGSMPVLPTGEKTVFPSCEKEKVAWQKSVHELPAGGWDAVIAGAGPAGSVAAVHLAEKGYRVALVDRGRFPREKTCGDGLMDDAIQCLARIGLDGRVRALGHAVKGASIYSPAGVRLESAGYFITLKRKMLDELVARRAVDAGAVFACGRVDDISLAPDGSVRFYFSGSRGVMEARVGVVATGANVGLMKKLGMVTRPRASSVASRCYVRSSRTIDRMMISFDRSLLPGYGWIFPVGNNEYNVGCASVPPGGEVNRMSPREAFRSFMESFSPARALMEEGEQISPLRGGVVRCGLSGSSPVGGGNLMAIGESIGSTYPATGEGIGKAMETGELAAEVIDQALRTDDLRVLKTYPARLAREMEHRYLGYKIAESWLSRAWLVDFVARRAGKSQLLRKSLAGILSETVDPRSVFSLRSLWKSFFS
jgi:geranylgeranyl reductase family protein